MLDFPGFMGWLSHERPFHSMDLLVASTGDILDSLKPHTIFGHSLGGWLTGRYACDCGEGVRSLAGRSTYEGPEQVILACSAGVLESKAAFEIWEHKFRRALDHGLEAMRGEIFAREPAWFSLVAGEMGGMLLQSETRQFVDSVREEHFLPARLKHVKAKTWLMFGEKDTLATTAAIPTWLSSLNHENARTHVCVLKDCGHSMQIEKLGSSVAALGQILAGVKPHRAGSRWYDVWEAS